MDDPASYHRTPPPLADRDLARTRGWALGQGYERVSWESRFAPHEGEPGSERWLAFGPNATATAALLRHDDATRPWVIAVHGFCMGFPFMDFPGLQAPRLHQELGMNVALPGPAAPRCPPGHPGERRAVPLLRAHERRPRADPGRVGRPTTHQLDTVPGGSSITLFGVSLGGYTVALLAGIEPGLDGVLAGIPVADFPGLFHAHSPRHIRVRAIEHRIMGGTAEYVYRVVSPLCFDPLVAADRRYIFAGYGDRLATPDQARRLAEHWGIPWCRGTRATTWATCGPAR